MPTADPVEFTAANGRRRPGSVVASLLASVVALAGFGIAGAAGVSAAPAPAAGTTAAAAPARAGTTAAAPRAQPVFANHSVSYDGRERVYLTVRPSTGSRDLPLIVFIAGTHSSAVNEFRRDYLLPFVQAGLVSVVYPVGLNREWNAGGHCCLRGTTPQTDDVGFVESVTGTVATNLDVDRRRIYLMGYSGGAKLAWHLACDSAGPFAALATYGGNPTIACPTTGRRLPVLMGFGAQDPDEPLAGRPANADGPHPPAARTLATWLRRDGCSPSRRRTGHLTRAVTVRAYAACAAPGLTVRFAVWNPGTHTLPHLPEPPFGRVAWNFVRTHSTS